MHLSGHTAWEEAPPLGWGWRVPRGTQVCVDTAVRVLLSSPLGWAVNIVFAEATVIAMTPSGPLTGCSPYL